MTDVKSGSVVRRRAAANSESRFKQLRKENQVVARVSVVASVRLTKDSRCEMAGVIGASGNNVRSVE
jgi:hypothetical protein